VIYSVEGIIRAKREGFVVITAGGVGYKIFVGRRTAGSLPKTGESSSLFCHHRVSESDASVYGFADEKELVFFELLLSVSGVGPKSALGILDVADLKQLSAAITEGRPDLLTQASGIGRKTAERIIIELRGKVSSAMSEGTVRTMETDMDLLEALVQLGYRREEARAALSNVEEAVSGTEPRLKAALKILQKR
jgi:Holliday junction DNA helicase RuvA